VIFQSSAGLPVSAFSMQLEVLLTHSALSSDQVALIADLLSLPTSGRYDLPEASPDLRKHRTMEAVLAFVTSEVHREPLLLLFEDVHWIDPTSLELLNLWLIGFESSLCC